MSEHVISGPDPATAAPLHRRLGDDLNRLRQQLADVQEIVCSMANTLTLLYGINHFTGCTAWRWPLVGPAFARITGRFQDDRGTWMHEGLDISVLVGQPVYAPHAGVVISAKFNSAYGNRVRIEWSEEGERWWVWLAHLSRWIVEEGQAVLVGDLVGYSGNTGNTTGPHLHVTVQRESNHELLRGLPEVLRGCVDPLGYISPGES